MHRKVSVRGNIKASLRLLRAAAVLGTGLTAASPGGTGGFNCESTPGCNAFWEQDGLRVTNLRGTLCPKSGGTNSVSSGSVFCNDVEGLNFVQAEGKTFTPLTIDVGEYSLSTSFATPVTFVGTKVGGAQVSFNVMLDGVRDGPGGQPDFQEVTFPAGFQDLVRLEVPTRLWSFDNLVFSAVIPFPLPADQKLGPGFREGATIYTKPAIDKIFMVGPDFHYAAGFYPPDRTQFMTGTDFSDRLTPQMSLDPVARDLYYVSSSTIWRYRENEDASVITLQQVVDAGYDVTSLAKPRGSAGQVYFIATNHGGSDSYFIFKLENGVLLPVVTPQILLPGTGGQAFPNNFPSSLAVRDGNLAFDTSLLGSTQKRRVFVRRGSGAFQQVLATGDSSPAGLIRSIDSLEFAAGGELEIRINRYDGGGFLLCHPDGSMEALAPLTFQPVNAGKSVSGEAFRAPDGTVFYHSGDEIYRKQGNDYFRVIGEGDLIGGQPVTYLRFLASCALAPRRIIVEVRLASAPSTDRHVELFLEETPVELPPRIGQVRLHPESGELFLPLSHLTMGREYWLRRSDDLETWQDLWKVPAVVPLQHLRIPPELLGEKGFYRVDERPAVGSQ